MSDCPQTPQAMLHRLPDKPVPPEVGTKPSKYMILITASSVVAGKVQIAQSVSNALSCPVFHGDGLHETAAKAASVGAPQRLIGADSDEQATTSGANEARYQRMWLSKMTMTSHLFPEESRPANGGFGGVSTSSTSRRGSNSSTGLVPSFSDAVSSVSSSSSSFESSNWPITNFINKPPVLSLSEDEKVGNANSALMAVTHPKLEKWHKESIRKAVGLYSIGVIFVPLDADEELPVLKPLDLRTMTSFASMGFSAPAPKAVSASLGEEIVLKFNVEAKVEDLIQDIIDGAREIMSA